MRKQKYCIKFFLILLAVLVSSCQNRPLSSTQKHEFTGEIPNLPEAVTNNAVALVNNNGIEMYSFNGLSSGKTYKDIHNKGFRYHENQWSLIPMPKGSQGVLASTAVSIDNNIYLIGGYTVDENKEEKSTKDIFKLDVSQQKWTKATAMPVPVDDTVALVYANRYIYLISGWHDDANVDLVQVYDTKQNQWFNATKYPAPSVFGHAGGIVGNQLIICDGVKLVVRDKKRTFLSSAECWHGKIDENNLETIKWEMINHHSNQAFYRMAATGNAINNEIIFVGGSKNPYNFNGIGYNSIASESSDEIFVYNLESKSWRSAEAEFGLNKGSNHQMPKTMDHRSLLTDGHWFYIIGGMRNNQKVTNKVIKFKYN